VVKNSPRDRILCNAVLDESNRVIAIRDKPAREEIVGTVRWCGLAAFCQEAVSRLRRLDWTACDDFGTLFTNLRSTGLELSTVEVGEAELNINTPALALTASMLEAECYYAGRGDVFSQVLRRSLRPLLRSAGVSVDVGTSILSSAASPALAELTCAPRERLTGADGVAARDQRVGRGRTTSAMPGPGRES
jgi:hypothetical protein